MTIAWMDPPRLPWKGALDPMGPTLVSLFAGAGGLDVGLEQAGFRTLLCNELEPYACESLRCNQVLRLTSEATFDAWFASHVLAQRCYKSLSDREKQRLRARLAFRRRENDSLVAHADIVERDVRYLPAGEILDRIGLRRGQVDLVAGGAPCQPFSRAGKREQVDCDTGQLFMEFVRIVDGLRPRWFLFENVKGLVIHKADVATISCEKCGAATVPPFASRMALKNAESTISRCGCCGQSGSHRVLWESRRAGSLGIIEAEFARLGYKCSSMVLNAADFGAAQHRERLFIVGSRDGERVSAPAPTHVEHAKDGQRTLFTSGAAPWRTMSEVLYRGGHWRYGSLDPRRAVLWVKNVVRPHDEPVTWTLDKPSPTIGAHQAAKLAVAPRGVPAEQLARQQWHVLGRRQGDTAPVFVEHEYLTDEELLLLQTFPRSWYLHGTRMQRAFQIGNAVPPVLARAMGQAIVQAMGLSTDIKQSGLNLHARHATRVHS